MLGWAWLLTVAPAAQQPPPPASSPTPLPPREAAASRPQSAPARISGTITAAFDGQPLHRVRITLTGPTANPLTTITDDRGNYEITEVPPGVYTLTVARAGYLSVQYGQRRPREAGRRLEVRAGQWLRNIDVALSRGAVLAGRVLDELGEPYPGVRVEALEPRFINGRRTPVPAGIDTTDDTGEFRISGLNPGTYTVRASTIETWTDDINKGTLAYSHTYFPGAAAAEQAEAVTLSVGQEVASLDFALVVGRAATVSGRVENATTEPIANLPVYLSRITRTIGGALLSSGPGGSASTGPDGTFVISGMAPGEYLLVATLSTTESVAKSVFLAGTDMTGLVLTPHKQSSVTGSVVTDDGAAPDFPAARVSVAPIASTTGALQAWEEQRPQTLRPDWTFTFSGMEGRYLFRVNGLPDDWMVQSVSLTDRDITDVPLDLPADGSPVSGVRIVLSQKGASVTGVVLDAHGAPLIDSAVTVFAENPALWGDGTRFVKSVRPDQEGHFVVAGLPAGTYLVAPKDFVADGEWADPMFLRTLIPGATRITLAPGTTQELSLTVEMH